MKQIMRSAIATIELGDVQMAGLSDYVGEMMGPFSNIWGSSNRDRQMEAYNEMMMIYGTMTRTLNVQGSTDWCQKYVEGDYIATRTGREGFDGAQSLWGAHG